MSVAAVFAIPVIIRREDSNPLAVLRDSAGILKRTWGESLVGFVGLKLEPDPCGGFEVMIQGFQDQAQAEDFVNEAKSVGFDPVIETS